MSPSAPLGRFVWYELLTTDPAAAKAFYPTFTGWATQAWGDDQSYTLWMNNGAPLAGLMALPDEVKATGAPPHWTGFVQTPDVDDSAEKAAAGGGTILRPPDDIPNVGRFAVIADPQGAVIALYTPSAEAPGHDGPPRPGEFSWHELATTDDGAALSFYSNLFGWEHQSSFDMGPGGVYRIYGQHGVPYGGIYRKPPEMPVPAWIYYILVPKADEAANTAAQNGGRVLHAPMEVPGGDRIAICQDPQGAVFAVHSKKQ